MSEEEHRGTEWRLLSRAERERRIIARVLRGDVLRRRYRSVTTAHSAKDFANQVGLPKAFPEILGALEKKGLITGYVPLLSDEGRRYFVGLGDLTHEFREGPSTTGVGGQDDECRWCHRPVSGHAKVNCQFKAPNEVTTELP